MSLRLNLLLIFLFGVFTIFCQENPWSDDVFLIAEASNEDPYVNEIVKIKYKLYVSPIVNVADFRPLDELPDFNNPWSRNIPLTRYEVKDELFRGEKFRSVILYQAIFFPQKPGLQEIQPLTLDVTLEIPTEKLDYKDGQVYTEVNKTVSTGNRRIMIKPLPDQGKPEDFSGAVGEFTFDVKALNIVTESKNYVVSVKVEGNGNLKLFEVPKLYKTLGLPIKNGSVEYQENIRTGIWGMSGSVTEIYFFEAKANSEVIIPSLTFSYFNPNTEEYHLIHSSGITLENN
jgi:hypothetical protein